MESEKLETEKSERNADAQWRATSYWIPITLLALGIGSIVMLIGSNWIREKLTTRDVVFVRSIGEIQTGAALAHLWVEELVSGDEVERHRTEIAWNLTNSQQHLNDLLRIESEKTTTALLADTDSTAKLLKHGTKAKTNLEEFALVSDQRVTGFDAGLDVGIGSKIDIYYDGGFRKLLDDLRYMERIVKERLKQEEARSSFIFQTILVAWIFVVGLAVSGIWNREWKRRQAEMALRSSEAQLLQSQKMEAVGRLAGGIAHDINNHLAAVTAQAELVKMKGPSLSDIEPRMDAIISTAAKSSALIKRLVAFSRRQPVVRETVEPARVVSELKSMLHGLIPEDIELTIESDADPWCIRIDPSQLEQVIVNLVVNARDAMPLGGHLTVKTTNFTGNHESLESQEWVVVSVQDNGVGIEPENEDRIFEPFFTTKDEINSSGLGLATVHGIVQQNQGYIEVKTELGAGATFTIMLPRCATTETYHHEESASSIPSSQRSETILLVEDNADLRVSMEEILAALGFSTMTAENAEDAIATFNEFGDRVDLLITDVIMPGMHGKGLADYLRDLAPDLEILFISGYTDEVILDRGIDQDTVNFLAKPFSASALAEKIEKILGRGAQSDAKA